jgi:hypothetical protein
MIKRDITETVYEYDNEGKLIKKTVTEKHEEEQPNQILNDFGTHNDWWKHTQVACNDSNTAATLYKDAISALTSNCSIQG